MSNINEIQPPEELLIPLIVPNKLLMGPGPSNCSPRVLHAMGYPILGHLQSETLKIMDDIKRGIQYVFQTKNTLTLCVSGTGHAGMESCFHNLLENGDTALFPSNGFWGTRAAGMASRCGVIPIMLEGTPGKSFSISQLESAIKEHRPKLLFVTQGETSTGVLQSLEGLGDICHKYNCLLVVDTVASLGGAPFLMDKWNIDVVYTGSQKVLGVPPGITPISFSPLATKRIFDRKSPVPVFYWDMKLLGEYWGCFEGKPRIYHHTGPINLMYALREGLALISEETIEKCIQRHQQCAQQLYDGLKQLGLNCFVENVSERLSTVTSVTVPTGLDWRKVISYASEKYSVGLNGGLGPTAGKIFRLGLMGYNATSENVETLLKVLDESIKQAKLSSKNKL